MKLKKKKKRKNSIPATPRRASVTCKHWFFVHTHLWCNSLLSQPFRKGPHNIKCFISSCRWVIKNQRFAVREPSITPLQIVASKKKKKTNKNHCLHQVSVTLVKHAYPKPNYSPAEIKGSFVTVVPRPTKLQLRHITNQPTEKTRIL